MIKIKLSSSKKSYLENIHYNAIYNNLGKKKSIEKFIKNEFGSKYTLRDFLIGNKNITIDIVKLYQSFSQTKKNRIIEEFKYFINQYTSKLSSTDRRENDFYKYNGKRYNAYTLCKILDINVCPYCNKSYIVTISDKENDIYTRPTLDHFFDKATYPFLSLSLYNLIPSCHICNSHIKKSKQFHIDTHIHPYFDDFNTIKRFSTNNELLSLVNTTDEFDIVFKNKKNILEQDIKKADKYINDLGLNILYNKTHKDKVLELVDLSRAYNKRSFGNIVNEFKDSTKIFKNENEVKRLMLCHHIENENIDKRPLNKLVKDISTELDII